LKKTMKNGVPGLPQSHEGSGGGRISTLLKKIGHSSVQGEGEKPKGRIAHSESRKQTTT